MSLTGQILQNRYRVIHQIGEGGMGRVYFGEDTRLKQDVAIKETLHLDRDEPSESLASRIKAFQREAHLLAGKIKHPAIPRVIDYFQFERNWYIIMEYIDGDSLEEQRKIIDRPFSVSEVLLWMDSLLQILDSLHNQSPVIIHRDIKPSNIKVKDNNVYLLDFGLAKQLTGSKSTIASFITPAFTSLEQLTDKDVSERSDLYSVGATMYCLLTNELPVSASERSLEILGGKPDPIEEVLLQHKIGGELANIILSAVSLHPEGRPPSAEAMRIALKGINQAEISVSPTEKPRSQPDVTLPSYSFLLNENVTRTKLDENVTETNSTGEMQKKAKKNLKPIIISLSLFVLMILGIGALLATRNRAVDNTDPQSAAPSPTPKTPYQIASELTGQAMEKIYESDYEAAKNLAKQAIDTDQTYALAYAIYGDAFWDSNQSEQNSSKDSNSQISKAEILKIFEKTSPSSEEEYAARAWAFLIDDKWERARQDIEKVTSTKSEWAWALALKASVLSNGICTQENNSKEGEKVIETLKQVVKLKPAYGNTYRQLGNQYSCMDKIPDAISSYEQAVTYWKSASNYTQLGNLHFYLTEKNKKKREAIFEKAKQNFLKAIEIDPNYSDAYVGLAHYHEAKLEFNDCVAEAATSLSKKDTADGNYWWSMCRYQAANKDNDENGFDEALEKIEKAKYLTKRSEDSNNKKENLAEFYNAEARIRYDKAIYLYNVKYKNNKASGKKPARKELEIAQISINNALAIDKNNKQYQSVKNVIDKGLRVLK